MATDEMVDALSYAAQTAMAKVQAEMWAKVEAEMVAALGIPLTFAGVTSTNYSGAKMATTTASAHQGPLKEWEARIKKVLRRDATIFWIAGWLPDWITQGRRELAEHLWVAQGVFEHNLRAMAMMHRLPARRREPDA